MFYIRVVGGGPSHLFVKDFGVDQPVKEGPEMTVADEWVFVLVPVLCNVFFFVAHGWTK
jgi:hypothetical protein